MSELAAKLDNLSLGDDRAKMLSYICRAKASKKYFACKNSYLVVPELKGTFILKLQIQAKKERNFQH